MEFLPFAPTHSSLFSSRLLHPAVCPGHGQSFPLLFNFPLGSGSGEPQQEMKERKERGQVLILPASSPSGHLDWPWPNLRSLPLSRQPTSEPHCPAGPISHVHLSGLVPAPVLQAQELPYTPRSPPCCSLLCKEVLLKGLKVNVPSAPMSQCLGMHPCPVATSHYWDCARFLL